MILAFIALTLTASLHAQMIGALSLPGLGGGANANAAVYPGDGVVLGTTLLNSKYQNGFVTALMWNTGLTILKGKYTVALAQPRLYDGNFENGYWPVTAFSPLQLSWELRGYNLQMNYSYLHGHRVPMNAHLTSLRGTTYLFDSRYSLNGGIVYEYRAESKTAGVEYGDAMVFEANASRHFKKGYTVGLFGYYNTNATPEYHWTKEVFNEKSTMTGLGVDSNLPLTSNLFFNMKYIFDMTANKEMRSNRFMLVMAYKF